jgi:hypothetical protein
MPTTEQAHFNYVDEAQRAAMTLARLMQQAGMPPPSGQPYAAAETVDLTTRVGRHAYADNAYFAYRQPPHIDDRPAEPPLVLDLETPVRDRLGERDHVGMPIEGREIRRHRRPSRLGRVARGIGLLAATASVTTGAWAILSAVAERAAQ